MTSAFGGTVDGVDSSFQSLADSIQELKNTGQTGILPFLYRLQAVGGKQLDLNRSLDQTWIDIADNLHRIAQTDPQRASWLARQIGADPGMIPLLLQGGEAIRRILEDQKKLAPTQRDLDAAAERTQDWVLLSQTFTKVGRSILTDLTPAIDQALAGMRQWLVANQSWLETSIADDLRALVGGIQSFASDVDEVVKDMGGWEKASELLFGLWLGGKVVALLANLALIKAAFFGIRDAEIAAASVPLGGGLLGRAIIIAAQLASLDPSKGPADEGGTGIGKWLQDNIPGFGDLYKYTSHDYWFGKGTVGTVSSQRGGLSAKDTEAYIRQSAVARGIDPNIAVAVARSEGLNAYRGDFGTSFGPFQLHYGGSGIAGMNASGLGDQFTKSTGLDARDPTTIRQQIDFALDWASKHGWSPWHGWHGESFAGIMRAPQIPRVAAGAMGAAAASITNNRVAHSANTTIGPIYVTSMATDASGIARDIGKALKNQSLALQANYGPS